VLDSQKIRLYHGTSTFWLRFILNDGLGAQNILEKYDVLRFGLHVKRIALKYLDGFEVMKHDKPYLDQMLSQKTGSGLGSWSHGSVFLSSCPYTAARYAQNEWGSEILTRAFRFVRAYSEFNDNLFIFFEEFESLYDVYMSAHNPIMLVLDLDKDLLLDEAGRDGEYLKKALLNMKIRDDYSIHGGPAFILKSTVEICIDQITIPIQLNSDRTRFNFLKVSDMSPEINKLYL
jgi:hypothetical protein